MVIHEWAVNSEKSILPLKFKLSSMTLFELYTVLTLTVLTCTL